MDKFGNIINENELLLLRYYEESSQQIKTQILSAAMRGNDTVYLKTIRRNIDNEIIKLKTKFQFYSTEQQSKTYFKGIKEQESNFSKLKIPFEPVKATTYLGFGGLHKEAIQNLAINTYKPLDKITNIIGRDCVEYLERTNFKDSQAILKALYKFIPDSEALRKVGISNVRGVVTGNTTWQQAIRGIRQDFAKQEIFKVPYYTKDGNISRLVDMRDYAELVARTTSAEAYREGAKNSIIETFGTNDLVQINGGSANECDVCGTWDGQIVSLTGLTEGFPTLDEAEAEGWGHPNCKCHYAVTLDVLDTYNEKNIDY